MRDDKEEGKDAEEKEDDDDYTDFKSG